MAKISIHLTEIFAAINEIEGKHAASLPAAFRPTKYVHALSDYMHCEKHPEKHGGLFALHRTVQTPNPSSQLINSYK
jgi:hypothetical protein